MIALLVYLQQPEKKEAGCTASYCIDYDNPVSTIKTYYGGNEDGDYLEFADSSTLQQYHDDVGHKYIRAWISAIWYIDGNFPLNQDGSYTWTNLNTFFDAIVYNTDSKPMVLFAHGDRCGSPRDNNVQPWDFSDCEGHGTVPPSNFNEFGDYVANVTQHFVNRYGLSEVNTWYFEIMNEPYDISDWDGFDLYYDLFNIAAPRIKNIVPNAKVGGYVYAGVGDALANSDYDFIDIHVYPQNYADASTDQEIMDAIPLMYNKIVSTKSQAGNVEVISGEYNMDTGHDAYTRGMQRPFVSAWSTASLIAHVKAGPKMEMIYQATCGYPSNSGCMGVWHYDGTTFQNYETKRLFTTYNTYNSTIYHDISNTDNFEILGIQKGGNRYITMVNKKDYSQSITLQVANTGATQVTNVASGQTHSMSGEMVSLNFGAYETKIFQVGEGGPGCPIDYSDFLNIKNAWVYCS